MGKPIAGRNKFPFNEAGIIVGGAKLADGTVLNDVHIQKQRSVLVFDLYDQVNDIEHQKLQICSVDANGLDLVLSSDDATLAAALKPGTFYVRAVDSADVQLGFVARFHNKKVSLADGKYAFNMDYTKGSDGVVKVVSVTIEGSIIFAVGLTMQLNPVVLPRTASNQAVTFTTSDATVATVSADGVVTAKKIGHADITVTTADGGKTAVTSVEIIAAKP